MAVGLILGARDKHKGNWVWDVLSRRLAMIDNEDCLHPPLVQEFYAGLDFIVPDRPGMKNARPMQEPGLALAAGLRVMHGKYLANAVHVHTLVDAHPFAPRNWPFSGMAPDEFVTLVFNQLA